MFHVLDAHDTMSAIIHKGDNFVTSCLLSSSSEKESTLKEMNLLPWEQIHFFKSRPLFKSALGFGKNVYSFSEVDI